MVEARRGTADNISVSKIRLLLLQDPRPQYVIAADIGFAPTMLAKYACGTLTPSQRHIELMMEFWGCEEEDLIGDVG